MFSSVCLSAPPLDRVPERGGFCVFPHTARVPPPGRDIDVGLEEE